MAAIVGSVQWQAERGRLTEHEAKGFLKGYLRYALKTDESLTHIIVRRGAGDFDIDGRIISRCEVVLAWNMLPGDFRLAIWDRVVKERPDYEVGIAHAIAARTVRWRVQQGLRMMVGQIFDEFNE